MSANKKQNTKNNNTKRKNSTKLSVLIAILSILAIFGILVIGHFAYKGCAPKKQQFFSVRVLEPTDPNWELKVNNKLIEKTTELNVKLGTELKISYKSKLTVDSPCDYSLLDSAKSNAEYLCVRVTDLENPETIVTEPLLQWNELEKLYEVSLFVGQDKWADFPKTVLQIANKSDFEEMIYTKSGDTVQYVYDDSLFVSTSPISYLDLTGMHPERKTVDRGDFNENLWIGSKVTKLADNFLCRCTGFNSNITFNEGKLTTIGGSFLQGCTMFNSPINFPESLRAITGDGFMKDCSNFNKPIDTKNITFISGLSFLFNCKNFNSKVTIGPALTWIPGGFLMMCTNFNQEITIPNNVKKIGDNFLYGCNQMVSKINVECDPEAFDFPSKHVCSTYDPKAPCFVEKMKIAGTYAKEWCDNFGYINKPEENVYRNLENVS